MVAYNIQWRPLSLNYKTIFIILPPNVETVNVRRTSNLNKQSELIRDKVNGTSKRYRTQSGLEPVTFTSPSEP